MNHFQADLGILKFIQIGCRSRRSLDILSAAGNITSQRAIDAALSAAPVVLSAPGGDG